GQGAGNARVAQNRGDCEQSQHQQQAESGAEQGELGLQAAQSRPMLTLLPHCGYWHTRPLHLLPMFSSYELTGRSRTHIVDLAAPACSLHRAVVEPFLALRGAAAREGIDLVAFSSFRDFDRQLAIWNAKASGERALLDADGKPLD